MKKILALVAVSTLLATSAMAEEPVTSNYKFSIGGYVKLDYAYNSENLGAAGTITPGGLGLSTALTGKGPGAPGNQEQSILGVKQSRIWFKADGPTLYGAKTGSLIEGDFYGDNSTAQESPQFRLRHAYGTIDWANTSILFGQYWDMFAPFVASTQDFRCGATTGAPNNPRSPQIKLTQRVNLNTDNQLQLVFGLTDPTQYGDNANVFAAAGAAQQPSLTSPTNSYGASLNYAGQIFFVSKSMGVAPGYFGLANNPFKIGFFGEYGNEHLKQNNAANAADTWGVGAYLFAPILKSSDGKSRAMTMSFEGQVYEAANMAFNAATPYQFSNALANTSPAAELGNTPNPDKAVGVAAQIIFYPTQALGLTAGYGNRINANKAVNSGTGAFQKYNQEIYFNAAYDLNAAVRVAGEYQNLEASFNNFNAGGDGGLGAALAGTKSIASVNIARVCLYYFF
jgi:hypothetical protein